MSFVALSPLPTRRLNVPSLTLEGKVRLGSLSFVKHNSCSIFNKKGNGWRCATVSGRLTSAEGDCKDCKRQLSFFPQKRSRLIDIRAEGNGTTGGKSENVEQPRKATVEKSKKILSLQKELLEQITKRKKLIAALKENIEKSSPSNQSNGRPEETFDETKEPASSYGSDSGVDLPSLPQSELPITSIPILKLDPDSPQTYSSHAPDTSSVVPAQPLVSVTPKSHGLEKSSCLAVPEMKKEPLKARATEAEKDATTAEVVVKSPPPAGDNVMNIVVVAAECAPWSKTGGLGDVVGALPKALSWRGHRVMVVAPRYSDYKEAFELGAGKRYNVAGQDFEVRYFQAYIDGVDYVFVDSPLFSHLGNNIYGGNREDILKRMVLLCKVAVEVPWHVPCGGVCYGDSNLVFIANDWHTALLPVYLQAYYRDNGLMHYTRSILVIHNIAHQGRGPLSDFRLLDLPEHYMDKFRLYDHVGGEHMNIFKAGLMAAHRIVAVSHGYAWECQTKEGGWGLDGIIQDNTWKLCGIVNGIDDKDWNPELDVFLKSDGYVNYGLDSLSSGKAACKAALQKELGLPIRADVPLVGFIGRLDHQKGVDIIAEAMPWITSQDLQLVMLGSGRADLEGLLRSFEAQYRDKVRGWVGFCVRTAHRITAGADVLLMPSRFEPCGLNQLYAMKYGTVPVVHAVGGLRDTVAQFDPYNDSGTGWTFRTANAGAMQDALGLALWTYRDFKKSWNAIQMRGMAQDLSWDNAAKQYEQALLEAKYQW